MNNHINNLLTNKSKLYSFVCRLSNAYCSACILGFFCCIIAFFKLMPFKMHHNISFIILEFLVLSFNLPEWLVTKHILGKNLEQLIININLIYKVSFVISSPVVILSIFLIGSSSIIMIYGLYFADYNAKIIVILLCYYSLLCSSFFNFLFIMTINALFNKEEMNSTN